MNEITITTTALEITENATIAVDLAAIDITTDDPTAEIIELHEGIESVFRRTLPAAIRIGELLTEQKARLSHGAFMPWVAAHLPFSHKTATTYMKVYEHRDDPKLETASNLAGAYRLLVERRPEPGTDDEDENDEPEPLTILNDAESNAGLPASDLPRLDAIACDLGVRAGVAAQRVATAIDTFYSAPSAVEHDVVDVAVEPEAEQATDTPTADDSASPSYAEVLTAAAATIAALTRYTSRTDWTDHSDNRLTTVRAALGKLARAADAARNTMTREKTQREEARAKAKRALVRCSICGREMGMNLTCSEMYNMPPMHAACAVARGGASQ